MRRMRRSERVVLRRISDGGDSSTSPPHSITAIIVDH
jgi:hypothetical protein